jgi:undecaprenyl diphosphate synthase
MVSFFQGSFMTQSNLPTQEGLHVAIIMDGNGRWATRRGLPRPAGHREGVRAVRNIVKKAPDLGISTLTLFAFSSDNWRRPSEEVNALMWLLQSYLRAETQRLVEGGARLTVIGRRDRLPAGLRRDIGRVEAATAQGDRLRLRVALDYSSRETIARAAANWPGGAAPSLELFGRLVSHSMEENPSAAAVDLLVRTGGEKRLSDFLLWECAYAELWFTDKMWPDFTADDLKEAINEFHRRERRFGAVDGGKARLAAAAAGPGQ